MKRFRYFAYAAIWLVIFGWSRSSETKTVVGYNEHGQRVERAAARSGELCAASGSYFAAMCEDSGFEVLIASKCQTLCSGPVDP